MREFTTAVEDVEAEDKREADIVALMASVEDGGKGYSRKEAEDEVDRGVAIPFKLDDRVLKAYPPSEGQLIFLMASMGRGQTQESRLASIVNVMMESLSDEDKDYFEGRLLSSKKSETIPPKVLESIFEGLTEEWFGNARPTQPSSGSAG